MFTAGWAAPAAPTAWRRWPGQQVAIGPVNKLAAAATAGALEGSATAGLQFALARVLGLVRRLDEDEMLCRGAAVLGKRSSVGLP